MNRDEIQAFLLQVTDWTVKAVPNFIAAILIMAFGWFAARTVSRLITQVLVGRTHIDQTLTPVIATFARYAILIITIVAVLGQMGVQIASVLAVLGAAGLAIGLALQGTLSNIAAGMMLLWLRPFRVGDSIDADGMAGKVEEIGLFATTMRTGEGIYRFVPNSALWNKPILNYARNASRRIEVLVRIDRKIDEAAARKVLLETAGADERVMKTPAPEVVVAAFNDVSVDLALRAWVSTADFGATNIDLAARARAAIRAANLSAT
ncbi:Small-conductance mechanosensitive channel [Alphaproteobacteria bacterium SO-S41]|nr:Small-conductance mechanosensitive channel [Alphaproteobacteria bacterium SO-S41]